MKKAIVGVLVLGVAAGVYFFMSDSTPKDKLGDVAKKDIFGSVSSLISGSGWRSYEKYSEEMNDEAIVQLAEREGALSFLAGDFSLVVFKGAHGGTLTFALREGEVQAIKAVFEGERGLVAGYMKKEGERLLGQALDFTTSGEAQSEKTEGSWSVDDGKAVLFLYRTGLEKRLSVSSLSAEEQKSLEELKGLVITKSKLEKEWSSLNEERQFCFDKKRFAEIDKRIEELKAEAAVVTNSAQPLINILPRDQVEAVRAEVEGE